MWGDGQLHDPRFRLGRHYVRSIPDCQRRWARPTKIGFDLKRSLEFRIGNALPALVFDKS